MIVPDTLEDPRFAAHPLVRGMPFIRFYAAMRLEVEGQTIGTLCIYDGKARSFGETQVRTLETLSAATVEALQSPDCRELSVSDLF